MAELQQVTDVYRLDKLVSASGLGSVFRAATLDTSLPAAVKLLNLPSSDRRNAIRADFLAVASRLELAAPAGLPRVRDHGVTAAGSAFLAMDFVDGRRAIDVPDASRRQRCRWLWELAKILDGLARSGIAHLSVRPDNLFLSGPDEGELLLMGLGSGPLLAGGVSLARSRKSAGAAAFLAPEIAASADSLSIPVDDRADLYSFAMTALFLLGNVQPGDEGWLAPDRLGAVLAAIATPRLREAIERSRSEEPDARTDGFFLLAELLVAESEAVEAPPVEAGSPSAAPLVDGIHPGPEGPSVRASAPAPGAAPRETVKRARLAPEEPSVAGQSPSVTAPDAAPPGPGAAGPGAEPPLPASFSKPTTRRTNRAERSAPPPAADRTKRIDREEMLRQIRLREQGISEDLPPGEGTGPSLSEEERTKKIDRAEMFRLMEERRREGEPPAAPKGSAGDEDERTNRLDRAEMLRLMEERKRKERLEAPTGAPPAVDPGRRGETGRGRPDRRPVEERKTAVLGAVRETGVPVRPEVVEPRGGKGSRPIDLPLEKPVSGGEVELPLVTGEDEAAEERSAPLLPPVLGAGSLQETVPLGSSSPFRREPPPAELPVPPMEPTPAPLVAPEAPPPEPPRIPEPRERRPIWPLVVLPLLLGVAIFAVVWVLLPSKEAPPAPAPPVVTPAPAPAAPAPSAASASSVAEDPMIQRLGAAEGAAARGDDAVAERELVGIPESSVGALSEADRGRYDRLLGQLSTRRLDRLDRTLATGIEAGNVTALGEALGTPLEVAGHPLALGDRTRRNLDLAKRILAAADALEAAKGGGAPEKILEAAGSLLALSRKSREASDAREQAASRIEAEAAVFASAGETEKAIASLEKLRARWRERAGISEKIRALQGQVEAERRTLSRIAEAEGSWKSSPEQGLERLKGISPPPSLAARFEAEKKRLSDRLDELDRGTPTVSLSPGTDLKFAKKQPVRLRFLVADDHGVRSAALFARKGTDSKWSSFSLVRGSAEGEWSVEVPEDFHGNAEFSFYVEALDWSGHAGRLGSASAPLQAKPKFWGW